MDRRLTVNLRKQGCAGRDRIPFRHPYHRVDVAHTSDAGIRGTRLYLETEDPGTAALKPIQMGIKGVVEQHIPGTHAEAAAAAALLVGARKDHRRVSTLMAVAWNIGARIPALVASRSWCKAQFVAISHG